ncbi:unnamed protein product [Closterium sp. NIES-65]|nr:unnamed protein product [Closterium sp. NIES-65]
MVGVELIPKAGVSQAVEALIARRPSFKEYLKWFGDQNQKTPKIPPTPSNQAVDQGAEAANVMAAAVGPSVTMGETSMWGMVEEAGGVDPDILASIVMPDPKIEVMREKLQAAAPTVGETTPAASSAPAEDPSTTGAKSPPATLGVRVDKETGLAVSELKFGKKSRNICRSMDKSEAAYCIAVAVSSFDGYVSDVILVDFSGVKEDVMEQYKSDWNVVRLIPGGMWTVIWSQVTVGRAAVFRRFQEVVAEYNRITAADRAVLMVALRPAVWFSDLPESTKDEKAAKNKMASDMIARASMCAAFAPVAKNVKSELLSEILAGTACAVWYFLETNATAEAAAGKGGAAATVLGASSEFASRCKILIEVVFQRASSWEVVVGEVADTVTKDLQGAVLRSLPEGRDARPRRAEVWEEEP